MKYTSKTPVKIMKKRAQFVKTSAAGESFVTKGFVVVCHNTEEGVVNIGFTASKKVGGAVQRNRAKRRLRALADKFLRLNAAFEHKGANVVLIARYAVLKLPFEKLEKQAEKALKEAGLL